MQDGKRARLYCCHSLLTRDALDEMHVLSVGVDLLPALDAQGFDGEEMVAAVAEACRRGGGDGVIPERAAASAPPRRCSISHGLPRRSIRPLASSVRAAAPARGSRRAACEPRPERAQLRTIPHTRAC